MRQKINYLPVENVEEAIESQERNIMRSQVLDNTHLVEHDDLRNECDGF